MKGKYTKKKQSIKYSILAIALVIGAYSIISRLPTVSNPIEKDWIGICVHSLSANEAKFVSESGAGWIRVDVSDDFGVAVTNAKAYNLSVLGILDSWMFNQTTTFTLKEWRDAVTHYVLQYSDYVDAWEIWNEPAHPSYSLSVERYYAMVQIASPIIRQYDPSAKIVLFGGLQLWSGDDVNLALDKEFARQLAAMNIEQYGDAISVHAYPWMEQVESWLWEKYDESLAYYRGLYAPLEIWITETGHPIESDGEDWQARYMRDALQYFQGKVTRLFWYSLLDNAADQKSFGLIGDETPRLAYYELQKQLTGKSDY
jgi:hypothetical protein